MNTIFTVADKQLQLDRLPLGQSNRSLQAWDAADELLLLQALPLLQNNAGLKILIMHDLFGALSCALGDYPHTQQNDSVLSQQATAHNRKQNALSAEAVSYIDSVTALPDGLDLVLLKVPNNHGYLRFMLQQLSLVVRPDTIVIAAAKAKDIHKNLLAIFEQELGPTNASLAQKKCRTIHCTPRGEARTFTYPIQWQLPDYQLTLVNHANVFAKEQLDIGARFLLEHLPVLAPGVKVADLGCGNGVLGLALLKQQPEAHIIFTDDSFMAVASSRASVTANAPELLSQAEFRTDDCLASQADQSLDYVICNPPFHQQQAVTEHIAWQMFNDAKRCLKPGGKLRIVANRHLPYYEKMTVLLGGCRHIASNNKFVILESTKRK
ncbi:methyltransferase [Rheinheimera sp.]|uniref:methyltransferase n=1 Tax=Rheinheimera sp. TaxID=1869214 RepID=UPI002628F189|nr:methyltransferase [Rheinheimera sp.]MCA1930583.1 methyltransferase [Rheinheimera sp.]